MRAALLAGLLVALLVGGCAPVASERGGFARGVALGLFAAPEEYDYAQALDEIVALGATDVSLVVPLYVDDAGATTVRRDPSRSPDDATIAALVALAHARSLRATLFPLVRIDHRKDGEWRGTLHPVDVGAFFASYEAALLACARAGHRADGLVIGSELVSLERYADRWRAIAAHARAAFAGRLLYSANWDRYAAVTFWDAVDAVGVSAYFELAPPGANPTVEELVRAWAPIRRDLVAFAARAGRPLVLTEVGYASIARAAAWPWNDTVAPSVAVASEEEQRRLYEAFVRAWSGEPALAGTWFWLWFGRGGWGDRSYSPRRKAAELVLEQWYRRRSLFPPPHGHGGGP